jgi:RND family efflux transporter MFP subunit
LRAFTVPRPSVGFHPTVVPLAETDTDLAKLSIDRTAPRVRSRARRRWPWLALLAALIATGAYVYWERIGGSVAVDTAAVTTAYPSQAYAALNATGYVVAQRKASVASKATGRLEWLGVMEGSPVKQGQVIARLEGRDVAAQRDQAAANVKVAAANVEQARAELRNARIEFDRAKELSSKNFVSRSALDSASARFDKALAALSSQQAALAVAEANLKVANVAVDQTLIRAPFDGVVLTKNANVGDNITPFSNALDTKGAVVTIADMDTLEVEADVSESQLARIRIDMPVEIQLDAVPGERFPGVVSRMVPTVDRAKATVLVKIRFAQRDPRVLPDMSAKVTFLNKETTEQERKPVIVVPKVAVFDRNGTSSFVNVVQDGVAHTVEVRTGRDIGDSIEVVGVEAGMRVVVKPSDGRSLDGKRVRTEAR